MGRSPNVSYHDLVRPEEEDWHMLRDSAERRKIQNRLAQRAYRRNIKYRSMELEKLKQELSEIRKKTKTTSEEQNDCAQEEVLNQPEDLQNMTPTPQQQQWLMEPGYLRPQADRGRSRATSTSFIPTTTESSTAGYSPQPYNASAGMNGRQRAATLSPGRTAAPITPSPRRNDSSPLMHSGLPIMEGCHQASSMHPEPTLEGPQAFFPGADLMELYPFASGNPNIDVSMDCSSFAFERKDSMQSTSRQQSPQPQTMSQQQPHQQAMAEHMQPQSSDLIPISISTPETWGSSDTLINVEDYACVGQNTANLAGTPPQHFGQETLLHLAARNGHCDVLRMLLQRGGMDINCRDAAGFTPLQLAVAAGMTEIVQILLDHGADMTALTALPEWSWV